MSDFLRKHRAPIFLTMAVILLLGAFLGFGGYFMNPKNGPNESVAEVEGTKIPFRIYYSHYSRAMAQLPADTKPDDATRRQKKEEALRDLVQGIIFSQLAKKYGIVVTDTQVVNSLIQIPAFQNKGQFDPRLYAAALQSQLKTTPQDFEEEQRQSIAFFKLRWLIQSAIQVTEKEEELAYASAHGGKMDGYAKEKMAFHDKLWEEKVVWCFNQWFMQVGQKAKVKVHSDVIEAGLR